MVWTSTALVIEAGQAAKKIEATAIWLSQMFGSYESSDSERGVC